VILFTDQSRACRHCHIPFHVSGGLAKQFIENPDKIDRSNLANINQECDAWSKWQKAATGWTIGDSGL